MQHERIRRLYISLYLQVLVGVKVIFLSPVINQTMIYRLNYGLNGAAYAYNVLTTLETLLLMLCCVAHHFWVKRRGETCFDASCMLCFYPILVEHGGKWEHSSDQPVHLINSTTSVFFLFTAPDRCTWGGWSPVATVSDWGPYFQIALPSCAMVLANWW